MRLAAAQMARRLSGLEAVVCRMETSTQVGLQHWKESGKHHELLQNSIRSSQCVT